MAVSRAMRRLLRIRELEEEQSRQALESALGELNRLENAMAATAERDRRGRQMITRSAYTGELSDRLAGLEESRAAARIANVLGEKREAAECEASGLRQNYLARRVERRQAEALIDEATARDALEAGRRGQQAQDDLHRLRLLRAGARTETGEGSECSPGADEE